MDASAACQSLYQIMDSSGGFNQKAEQALVLGREYLDVDNAHVTEIYPDSDYWESIASTDLPDGQFPAGLTLELGTTFCRHVLTNETSLAIYDAAAEGWADDPAFEAHEIHCYHGSALTVNGDVHGTVCFISEAPREEPFDADETMFAELITRLLEQELQRNRIEHKIEQLEQVAEVLAHDLRNPLSVAQGYLAAVQETTENEDVATVADALDQIDTIISDTLTIARQGQRVQEIEEIQLSTMAKNCWRSVPSTAAKLSVPSEGRILAAPDRLKRLFENLFRNSVEHGGEAVTIRVGLLPDGDGFYVADDGVGIPDEDREAIFERGYSTGTEGVGLGLAIVEAVVSAHGWRIEVVEGTDGGARFEIRDVSVIES